MFSTLNFGNPADAPERDPPENIHRNEMLLMRAALEEAGQSGAAEARELCRVHQVHGAAVEVLRRGEPADFGVKADALVTDDPQRFVSIRTADCVPILVSSSDGGVVAAVHAGWRGLVAGVIAAAIESVRRVAGPGDAQEFVAAIGPCIGAEVYEVGPEVGAAFESAACDGHSGTLVRPGTQGKHRLDLAGIAERQLVAAGIARERIDRTDRCSFRDADEFFSHRRERGLTGRMASIIGAHLSDRRAPCSVQGS
jgi:YfiH family protein